MEKLNRRSFIQKAGITSVGTGLALSSFPAILKSNPLQTSKLQMAIIGVNSRGSALARGFTKTPDAEVAFICDVDDAAMAKGIKAVEEAGQQKKPKGIKDFRTILEDDAVDAVAIATPDHWHAPAAIMALKAGKHVYVEKPGSHNPHEAEMVTAAMKKYGKPVQMGNQRRSWPYVVEGIQQVHDGIIGKAYYARAWYANTRGSIGHGKQVPVPAGLDYELWQGPAPRKPYQDNLIHYNWHWFWNWGTGEILNNGTHFIDLCRWGLQVDYPTEVSSLGGRYAYNDDWQTPDTQLTSYNFADGKSIHWEGRSCNGQHIEGISAGVSFHGEEGTVVIAHNGYLHYDNKGNLIKKVDGETSQALDTTGPGFDLDADHIRNFTNSVFHGEELHSNYAETCKSVVLCHLGNMAHRTGETIKCNPATGKPINGSDAIKLWSREYEVGWKPEV